MRAATTLTRAGNICVTQGSPLIQSVRAQRINQLQQRFITSAFSQLPPLPTQCQTKEIQWSFPSGNISLISVLCLIILLPQKDFPLLYNNSFFFIFIYFMYMNFLPACLYVHSKCARWQWRPEVELKLQVVVSATWVLRIKPKSSGRAVSILNH